MKSALFKSLLALGTAFLAYSCSDDKPSSHQKDDINIVPCEDVSYLPAEGLVIFADNKVTDVQGNQVGKATQVIGTNFVIINDMYGNTIINQLNLTDANRVKQLKGDPVNCNFKFKYPPVDPSVATCIDAWYLGADSKYLIYADMTVTDVVGNAFGIIAPNATNPTLWDLKNATGNTVIEKIDLNMLPLAKGDGIRYKILEPAFILKDATGTYLIYSNTVVTNPNGIPVGFADFATGVIKATDNVTPITAVANFTTLPIMQTTAKCADYQAPVPPSSSSTPIKVSSSSVKPITSSTTVKSSTSVKSSASVKSSSSQKKSSSSKATPVTGCPTIKKKGNLSGSGWATRYWDCCKPSCSWAENSGGNPAKQCSNKGKSESTDWGAGSVCSGGSMMTCTSQIPFTVDGCTEMGFAFAAVPAANGGQCGKCFQLTFTGEGHYNSTNANTKAIKGKKLIIMATNIGGDVQQGQFDILIPGGGVGMFNGCSSMGWGSQGEQYGGLLSDCEKSENYNAAKMLTCLKNKCNSSFGSDTEAKKGCMFLAEFMHAAGNPEHNYIEVECPEVLKSRY